MKRYKTLSAFDNEIVECSEKTNCDFEESVTDPSFFVPESELIKRLHAGVAYGQALQGLYDFSDGKDTGINVPLDRYKGIDRAELSEAIRTLDSSVTEHYATDLENAKKAADEKAAAEKAAAENSSSEK